MDGGVDETELRGRHERVGGKVKMSPERGGGEARETTGGEMKVIHHQCMKRDTMVEEERRGENVKEKRARSGIRIKEERGIVKEVGKERGVQIKRKKLRGGALLQHLRVIGLPLLGHTAVTFSSLQKMMAEVRRYGTLESLIGAGARHLASLKIHFRIPYVRFVTHNMAAKLNISFPYSTRESSSPSPVDHGIFETQL